MSTRTMLTEVLDRLSEERLRQLLEYACFLAAREEREDWSRFGLAQLAKAYGPDEPEYTEADIKPELNS